LLEDDESVVGDDKNHRKSDARSVEFKVFMERFLSAHVGVRQRASTLAVRARLLT
jgi:hypothetical protein